MLSRSTALMGTGLAALLAILTGYFSVPSLVRISIGILIVFFLPGFALVCATRPKLSLGLSRSTTGECRHKPGSHSLHGRLASRYADRAVSSIVGSCTWRGYPSGIHI